MPVALHGVQQPASARLCPLGSVLVGRCLQTSYAEPGTWGSTGWVTGNDPVGKTSKCQMPSNYQSVQGGKKKRKIYVTAHRLKNEQLDKPGPLAGIFLTQDYEQSLHGERV